MFNPYEQSLRTGSWGNAGVRRIRANIAANALGVAAASYGNLIELPPGLVLVDWAFYLRVKGTNASTMNAGLYAKDGSGYLDQAGTIADSATALASALVIGSAGTAGTVTRRGAATALAPVATAGFVLEKPTYLKLAGVAAAAVTLEDIDVTLWYDFIGNG